MDAMALSMYQAMNNFNMLHDFCESIIKRQALTTMDMTAIVYGCHKVMVKVGKT